jgi:hypothetical protein
VVPEPAYEKDLAARSIGFRPGMGCKDALRRVAELLRVGYVHVVPREAAEAVAVVRGWTEEAGLTPRPVKTRLVDAWDDGFDFLGCHFERGRRWPGKKSQGTFRDAIRAKTGWTVGHGLPGVIADINPIPSRWFNYFRHSHRPTSRIGAGWAPPLAAHPSTAAEIGRHREDARSRSRPLAERLLCQKWVVQLARSP